MTSLEERSLKLIEQAKRRMMRRAKRRQLVKSGQMVRPIKKTIKQLREELKTLVHTGVKIRDKRRYGGLCPTCRKNPITTPCHIIPSSKSLNTKYDPENIYGGCRGCNGKELWQRTKFVHKFYEVFGSIKMADLNRKSDIRVKWGWGDYDRMVREARWWLENIMSDKGAKSS
jgi:5-methylcytosine-specific restriction endonuclease McrA